MTREEKNELIKLSDLNREDNIKYISSEAQGIAITLDSDRYAPTFCKLERAYICGRRKSEKKIADLEEINAILSESSAINQKDLEYKVSVIKQRNKMIEELEKENAELKREVIENKSDCLTCYPHIKERLEKQLAQAKDLIKNILHVTWGEGWNYSLDWKVKAEQFLKEIKNDN